MSDENLTEQILYWEKALQRAEARIRAVEDDLRFYRGERQVASEELARLRVRRRREGTPLGTLPEGAR